jgi:hypothetical protein
VQDETFSDFNYWQWLQGPYTLDGKTIYDVTHMEWYGALVKPSCGYDTLDDWISAITLTVSTDMGKSFQAPADYIIRNPSTPWSNSFPCTSYNPTRYGDVGGSNVIYNNGYFYKYFLYETEPAILPPQAWQCVMRTNNLASASSWKIWTGSGWVASKEAPCAPLANLQTLRSVTYNTFLKMYMGIQFFGPSGVFFSVSTDLINWTVAQQIYLPEMNTSTTPYTTIIDPTDTTLNFERSGQTPYLYYAQTHPNTTANDTMRIKLEISLLPN